MNKGAVLITGGAGFIGSHLLRFLVNKYPDQHFVNLDNLTYAGNLENLSDIASSNNYSFEKGDIGDYSFLDELNTKYNFSGVIHLAAESHVDRSISNPLSFLETNIMGTAVLLNACKTWHQQGSLELFYHVSTDEVYGSLGEVGLFSETTAYDPRSPYSASKASSDHLVRAYHHTYGLPVKISNCSNNYGPNQFPEKLLPLMIMNIKNKKSLPVYGEGLNVRDWLWVEDHVKAIDLIYNEGKVGETYNIGGDNEWRNIDVVHLLCELMDEKLDRSEGESKNLITFVKDRAGHDLRYAIDYSKLNKELGWAPTVHFKEGLKKSIDWYLSNSGWIENVISGDYMKYYKEQYEKR